MSFIFNKIKNFMGKEEDKIGKFTMEAQLFR